MCRYTYYIYIGIIYSISIVGMGLLKPQLLLRSFQMQKNQTTIGIHQECEGGIEKSVPMITDWYHEACGW